MNPHSHTQYMLPNKKFLDKSGALLPQKIGPYPVTKLLGKGGMSYLYLGIHNREQIVIKVLSPKLIANRDISSRFQKEAEIIALADHPNVVRLLGQGTWEKGLYIAMEFIEGTSLRQFMQREPLSQDTIVDILLKTSYAVCHLHTHGIIHRDLKPENILITESRNVKVIDFGIAHIHGENENQEEGGLIGTPTYMSPEQRRNPSQATFVSDIYSLGILTYELFGGDTKQGRLDFERIPKSLRPVLEKATHPQIEKRYPDIVDWITAIKGFSTGIKKTDSPPAFKSISWISPKIPEYFPAQITLPSSFPEGSYLEIFEIEKRRILLAYVCPIDSKDAEYTPILVGMMRMAIDCEMPSVAAIPVMGRMRKVFVKDSKLPPFCMAVLCLDGQLSQFSFLACGPIQLLKTQGDTTGMFITPNSALGAKQSNNSLLSTGGTFETGTELHLQKDEKTLLAKIERKLF